MSDTKTIDGMNPATQALLLTVRQAMLMLLGALEDALCLSRSVVPNHKRR